MMNRIDEASNEFEYSSGWKKIIKDKNKEKINEEFRVRIEDLEIRLEELESSIASLTKKWLEQEKITSENNSTQQIIMGKIDRSDRAASEMEGKIGKLQNELIQYMLLVENQSAILSSIMNILKTRDEMETMTQKSFLANIFKKK